MEAAQEHLSIEAAQEHWSTKAAPEQGLIEAAHEHQLIEADFHQMTKLRVNCKIMFISVYHPL